MPDTPTFEILLFIIIAASIGIVYWFSVMQRNKSSANDNYIEALEYLADGNDRLAIQKLKETVREDTENVAAYLRLGDLLRKKGLLSNATRIHKDLTLRTGLDKQTRSKILKSLLRDYDQLNDIPATIETGKKILELERTPENWVLKTLLDKYENTQQWQDAEALIEKYGKYLPEINAHKLALYSVFKGLAAREESREKDARVNFKEAIKRDPQCAAAYYYLGQSYASEERFEDAAKIWTRLCNEVPEKAHIVYSELEKVWFEMGRFHDAEHLYQDQISKNKNSIRAGLALAEIYNKKGEHDHALEIINQLEENYPDSPELLNKKIKFFFNKGQYKQAANQSLNFLQSCNGTAMAKYTCRICQNNSAKPLWICPKCQNIDTYNI